MYIVCYLCSARLFLNCIPHFSFTSLFFACNCGFTSIWLFLDCMYSFFPHHIISQFYFLFCLSPDCASILLLVLCILLIVRSWILKFRFSVYYLVPELYEIFPLQLTNLCSIKAADRPVACLLYSVYVFCLFTYLYFKVSCHGAPHRLVPHVMVMSARPNGFDVNLSWYCFLYPFFYFPLIQAKSNKNMEVFMHLKDVIVPNMNKIYYGRLTL